MEDLEKLFSIRTPEAAVLSGQICKSPDLGGIPYEFYKRTIVQRLDLFRRS
jgi:hypothetical protein